MVYKGHLNGDWEGAKQTNLVAVKTLKGSIMILMQMSIYFLIYSRQFFNE